MWPHKQNKSSMRQKEAVILSRLLSPFQKLHKYGRTWKEEYPFRLNYKAHLLTVENLPLIALLKSDRRPSMKFSPEMPFKMRVLF